MASEGKSIMAEQGAGTYGIMTVMGYADDVEPHVSMLETCEGTDEGIAYRINRMLDDFVTEKMGNETDCPSDCVLRRATAGDLRASVATYDVAWWFLGKRIG